MHWRMRLQRGLLGVFAAEGLLVEEGGYAGTGKEGFKGADYRQGQVVGLTQPYLVFYRLCCRHVSWAQGTAPF